MEHGLGVSSSAEEGRTTLEGGRTTRPVSYQSPTGNISSLRLWNDNPDGTRLSNIVRVEFRFPCTWTVFHIEDLLNLLRLWIVGEELKYPREKGFQGRDMLKAELLKVFDEV